MRRAPQPRSPLLEPPAKRAGRSLKRDLAGIGVEGVLAGKKGTHVMKVADLGVVGQRLADRKVAPFEQTRFHRAARAPELFDHADAGVRDVAHDARQNGAAARSRNRDCRASAQRPDREVLGRRREAVRDGVVAAAADEAPLAAMRVVAGDRRRGRGQCWKHRLGESRSADTIGSDNCA